MRPRVPPRLLFNLRAYRLLFFARARNCAPGEQRCAVTGVGRRRALSRSSSPLRRRACLGHERSTKNLARVGLAARAALQLQRPGLGGRAPRKLVHRALTSHDKCRRPSFPKLIERAAPGGRIAFYADLGNPRKGPTPVVFWKQAEPCRIHDGARLADVAAMSLCRSHKIVRPAWPDR